MLTNEQRAHDLTISTLQFLLNGTKNGLVDIKLNGYSVNADRQVSIDFFKMYIDLYNQLLESVNNEFPKES